MVLPAPLARSLQRNALAICPSHCILLQRISCSDHQEGVKLYDGHGLDGSTSRIKWQWTHLGWSTLWFWNISKSLGQDPAHVSCCGSLSLRPSIHTTSYCPISKMLLMRHAFHHQRNKILVEPCIGGGGTLGGTSEVMVWKNGKEESGSIHSPLIQQCPLEATRIWAALGSFWAMVWSWKNPLQ